MDITPNTQVHAQAGEENSEEMLNIPLLDMTDVEEAIAKSDSGVTEDLTPIVMKESEMGSEIAAMRQAEAGIGHIRDEIERMTREDFWAKAMRGGSLDNSEDHMGENAVESAENGNNRQEAIKHNARNEITIDGDDDEAALIADENIFVQIVNEVANEINSYDSASDVPLDERMLHTVCAKCQERLPYKNAVCPDCGQCTALPLASMRLLSLWGTLMSEDLRRAVVVATIKLNFYSRKRRLEKETINEMSAKTDSTLHDRPSANLLAKLQDKPVDNEVEHFCASLANVLAAAQEVKCEGDEYAVAIPRGKEGLCLMVSNTQAGVSVVSFARQSNGRVGPAQNTRKIQLGDVLLAVNGHDVVGLPFVEVVKTLGKSSSPVFLRLRRPNRKDV